MKEILELIERTTSTDRLHLENLVVTMTFKRVNALELESFAKQENLHFITDFDNKLCCRWEVSQYLTVWFYPTVEIVKSDKEIIKELQEQVKELEKTNENLQLNQIF